MFSNRIRTGVVATAFALSFFEIVGTHPAAATDGVVKIAVLNDASGPYADTSGVGSLVAAQMAIDERGGIILGMPIQLVGGDHQNKPDIGTALARRWFDNEKVDVIVDIANSAVALALQHIAVEKNRILIGTSIAAKDFTGKNCSPNTFLWGWDSYPMANIVTKTLVKQGFDTWYLLGVDYAFGRGLVQDATSMIESSGGKVLGSAFHPTGTHDFSAFLVRAQASGAKVVGFANTGADMATATKQAGEFGLKARLAPMVTYITDIHSLGLKVAQGLTLATPFFWNRNEDTRAWSKQFMAKHGKAPTFAQASVYSAVKHYLNSIEVAGSAEAQSVSAAMHKMPVDDMYSRGGRLRKDGMLAHDMYVVRVKSPDESKEPWDYYELVTTVPGESSYRPFLESECPLVK